MLWLFTFTSHSQSSFTRTTRKIYSILFQFGFLSVIALVDNWLICLGSWDSHVPRQIPLGARYHIYANWANWVTLREQFMWYYHCYILIFAFPICENLSGYMSQPNAIYMQTGSHSESSLCDSITVKLWFLLFPGLTREQQQGERFGHSLDHHLLNSSQGKPPTLSFFFILILSCNV